MSALSFSAREKDYTVLSPSEQSNDNIKGDGFLGREPPQRQSLLQIIIGILIIALLTMTTMYTHLLVKTMPPRLQNCGHSVEEAQALGCTFDELSKLWLPAVCPKYGGREYVEAGIEAGNGSSWHYYADQEGTREYTLEEVAGLGKHMIYWTTKREHAHHCMWMMVRMAHVFKTGERKDSQLLQFGHAKHCVKVLLQMALYGQELDRIDVSGDVGFGHC